MSTRNTGDNIVNELLLSANELNIYGESSLIDNKYKESKNRTDVLLEQIKSNPVNAYQAILKKKLNKLKKQQSSAPDFYVKPVPK